MNHINQKIHLQGNYFNCKLGINPFFIKNTKSDHLVYMSLLILRIFSFFWCLHTTRFYFAILRYNEVKKTPSKQKTKTHPKPPKKYQQKTSQNHTKTKNTKTTEKDTRHIHEEITKHEKTRKPVKEKTNKHPKRSQTIKQSQK